MVARGNDLTSMNVSLPRAQREFVQNRIATGGYGSISEYIRELIRRDEKERARDELERKLLQGLDSGPAAPFDKDYFENLRKRIQKSRAKNGR